MSCAAAEEGGGNQQASAFQSAGSFAHKAWFVLTVVDCLLDGLAALNPSAFVVCPFPGPSLPHRSKSGSRRTRVRTSDAWRCASGTVEQARRGGEHRHTFLPSPADRALHRRRGDRRIRDTESATGVREATGTSFRSLATVPDLFATTHCWCKWSNFVGCCTMPH